MDIITCKQPFRCSMKLFVYKTQSINLQFKSMDGFLYSGHTGLLWDKMDIPNKKKNTNKIQMKEYILSKVG